METKLTKEIKLSLLKRTIKKISVYGAFEVSFKSRYFKDKIKERCDYVEFDGLNFTCYEIKISKSDFLSKSVLSTFGQKNYIVAPEALALWIKQEGSKDKGLGSFGILAYTKDGFHVIKRCSKLQFSIADNTIALEGFAKAASRDLSNLLLNCEDKKGKYANLDK